MGKALVAAAITTVATATAATAAVSTAAATAAVSTAAAAAATLVATATATTRAIFTRTRFIDLDGAALHVDTVEFFDSRSCLFIGREGNESESARTAGLTVKSDHDVRHGAHLAEGLAKRVFGAAEGEVPHV